MEITKEKVIIAEGKDEFVFLSALCRRINVECQIIDAKGVEKIPGVLAALLQDDNFDNVKSLAIIRDADNNPKGALDGINHHLKDHKLPTPKSHSEFSSNNSISIGIFIAPGRDMEIGMLETLISSSLTHHPAHNHAESYIEHLTETLRPKNPKAEFDAPKNPHKAKLYATFAGMKKSPNTIGTAIEQNCIDLNHAAFEELRSFLSKI